MSLSFSFVSGSAARAKADLFVVPVFAERELGPGGADLEKAISHLRSFMTETNFEGKIGETLAVPTAGKLGAKAVVLVGLGDRKCVTANTIRDAAASVARKATNASSVVTTLTDAVGPNVPAHLAVRAVAEGFCLGSYEFLRYKGDAEKSKLRRVIFATSETASKKSAVRRANIVCDAVSWARDLVNEPASAKSPQAIAADVVRLMANRRVQVQVLDERRIKFEGLGGVAGVGQGSENPPRFLRISYIPGRTDKSVALVGKGVVFDSGGLSIKPAEGMEEMKTDMAGAAAVIATMSVLAQLDIKTKVIAYLPLVENMPSGSAIRPGDVLTIRNGKTVEVLNTDAEGRLILADGLSLAVEDNPDAIVDLATLTGACMIALGDKIAGLMGNNDEWCSQVQGAAERAGESVWPLPLPAEYNKHLESEIADLKNIGIRYGGALTAGLFLQAFVEDVPWVHMDIAGPARAKSDDGVLSRGGTGFGVQTLVELLENFEKPPRPKPMPGKKVAPKKVRKISKIAKTVRKTTRKTVRKPVRKATRKRPGR